MKGTETFKATILKHLKYRAFQDPLFKTTLEKPHKNIDDCVTYILNRVKKSQCNGFEDDEIFSMAVHYYDEDDIKKPSEIQAEVVVNHQVKLSIKEIEKLKEEARNKVINEEIAKMRSKPTKAQDKPSDDGKKEKQSQNSLF